MIRTLAALAAFGLLSAPVSAKLKPVWRATANVDPITGKRSCVVAAFDQAAGLSFTQTGAIYPVVELNGEHGLLVGVSSGGRIRLPTGDILWRVDELPHRELKAADNPGGLPGAMPADANQLAQLTQQTLALTRAMTATSTLASGDKAWAMLAELRTGRGLQFRRADAETAYGLPQEQTQLTGQMTRKGLRPYPIDASFHEALATCGIGERPA